MIVGGDIGRSDEGTFLHPLMKKRNAKFAERIDVVMVPASDVALRLHEDSEEPMDALKPDCVYRLLSAQFDEQTKKEQPRSDSSK